MQEIGKCDLQGRLFRNLEELQVGNGSSEAALGVQLPALEVQ